MTRLRKVPVKTTPEDRTPEAKPKAKEKQTKAAKKSKQEPTWMQGDGLVIAQLILSIQKTDCNNLKVIKELNKLYKKMQHESFFTALNNMIMLFLMRDEQDDFAPRVLKFIGLFVASYGEETDEDGSSHPLVKSVFKEILAITSKAYYIRARICSLVKEIMTSFSQRAELDEELMDTVIDRMIGVFIKDISPVVRQNAIMALQRLQDPENTEDQVTKAYIYHMETDPISKVRQSVITAIAKKITTIPYVIERLRDNDEKVRRHTYLQMASYPVKSYKIRDRINIMNAGLYDRSEVVKKAVNNVLLPNWLAAYDNEFVDYIKAIKLDASDVDLNKFRTLAPDALNAVFNKFKVAHLLNYLNISKENEFSNCLSIEKTNSLEWLIVWKVVMKRHQAYLANKLNNDRGDEDNDTSFDDVEESIVNMEIMPELSTFCEFMEKFLNNFKIDTSEGDFKYRLMNFNHCLIVLLEFAQMNDLGDEIGRNRLQMLMKKILMEHDVSDYAIKEITHVIEQIIPSVDQRLKFFNDIVTELLSLSAPTEYSRQEIIEKLIGKADNETELKVSSLKMIMMELKEKERLCVESKRYAEAHKVSEEYARKNAELVELLRPFDEESGSSSQTIVDSLSSVIVAKKATPSEILKSLRVCYYAIVAKGVKTLTPEIHKTYNTFVRFHLESSDITVSIWALKTATAYSLLYESLAKEVYDILKSQLFKSTNFNIWEVTICCIIDLLLRYSIEKMDRYNDAESEGNQTSHNRSKRGGRTLYSDEGDETEEMDFLSTVPIMHLLIHLIDNTQDIKVHKAITIGFCKLILHGQFCTREIMSKFLIAYFNPATDAEINQLLGIFFENVVRKKKQELLEDALVSTLVTLLEAPHDSPLHEVKQETVIRYVIEATRPIFCSNGLNLHNTICLKLIDVMKSNPENKEIMKVFSKELMTLEIGDDPLLKKDITSQIDTLNKTIVADVRTKKNISDFCDMLKGTYKPPLTFSSTAMSANIDEDDDAGIPGEAEGDEDEETLEPTQAMNRIALDDVMDVSLSQANVRDLVVNVTKMDAISEGDSSIESVDVTMNESLSIDIPETPENASKVENLETKNESQEVTKEESSSDSSDDEANQTAFQTTKNESFDAEVIVATPKAHKGASRTISSKRQLELTATKNSPMRKNPRNGGTPKHFSNLSSPGLRSSTASQESPSTRKSSSRLSKPLSDEPTTPRTRKQAQEAIINTLTLTRSASRKMNIDVASKVDAGKESSETSKPTRVGKATAIPVPTKASLLRAAKSENEVQKKQAAAGKKPADQKAGGTETKPSGISRSSVRQRTQAAQNAKPRPRWN